MPFARSPFIALHCAPKYTYLGEAARRIQATTRKKSWQRYTNRINYTDKRVRDGSDGEKNASGRSWQRMLKRSVLVERKNTGEKPVAKNIIF